MKFILVISTAILSLAACSMRGGSGNIVTEQRQTAAFTGVKASGGFEVEIVPSGSLKLTIEADDNVIGDIVTKTEGDVLHIKMRSGLNWNNFHAKIYISAPGINLLETSGGAEAKVNGTLKSDEHVKLQASSGSSIKANIDAPSAAAGVSSGGDIEVSGRTQSFEANASSGSEVDAEKLLTETTVAQASSGGSISVHASVRLNGQASSGGTIRYRGNPQVSKQESSGGSISKED